LFLSTDRATAARIPGRHIPQFRTGCGTDAHQDVPGLIGFLGTECG